MNDACKRAEACELKAVELFGLGCPDQGVRLLLAAAEAWREAGKPEQAHIAVQAAVARQDVTPDTRTEAARLAAVIGRPKPEPEPEVVEVVHAAPEAPADAEVVEVVHAAPVREPDPEGTV